MTPEFSAENYLAETIRKAREQAIDDAVIRVQAFSLHGQCSAGCINAITAAIRGLKEKQ